MKKRRTLIALFLLCACLVMAVGYAQLQSAISITGGVDVTSKNTDLKVVFSDYAIATDSEGKVTAAADNTTAARMTVSGISAENEYVEVTFTIVNMLLLINTYGNNVCLVEKNICCHKSGVGEETCVDVCAVLLALVLELCHT